MTVTDIASVSRVMVTSAENGQQSELAQVAVLGPLGTYTHEAAHSRFGPEVTYQECQTIRGVFDLVSSASIAGVVPQENSIFGAVVETYDALREKGFVCGEITLRVQHCLVVRTGVKLRDIRRVLSHEQALGQCQSFLSIHLPRATTIKTPSTAAAARMLLETDPDCAAICSKVCVKLLKGLTVLEEGIQNVKDNFTRFYIISKDNRSSLQTHDQRRALIRVVNDRETLRIPFLMKCLSKWELDCPRIDRRPSPSHSPFCDLYFIELQECTNEAGESFRQLVDRAVQQLREYCKVYLIGFWGGPIIRKIEH